MKRRGWRDMSIVKISKNNHFDGFFACFRPKNNRNLASNIIILKYYS